jgi:hypothetical protein
MRARGSQWIERAALAALVGVFLWQGLVPAWRHLSTDFPNYYLAARAYRDGLPLERLYDAIWIQRLKDHAGLDQDFVGYVPLTLYSALPVVPLASLPALAAKRVWLAASLLVLAATIWLSRRLTALPARRVALLVFLAVVPLRTNFQFGQQHLLVLALLGLAAWLDVGGRPARAGAVLAVAAALKVYPALFVLFFLRRRRWRAVAGMAAAGAALALLGLALFGWEPWRVYLVEVVPRALLRGEVVDPYELGNGLTGLLRRLFVLEPALNPHPLADAPAAFALLQSAITAALLAGGLWLVGPGAEREREDPRRARLDWACFVTLLLVLSSGPASYHLCALVLPAVLGVDHLLAAGRPRHAALLVATYAAVCLPLYGSLPAEPEGWVILLAYPRLYALLAFAGVLAAACWPLPAPLSPRARPRAAAAFAVAAAALAMTGAASNHRHLVRQRDYVLRLPDGEAWTASQPAVAGDDVYFTRMQAGGFSVDRSGSPIAAVLPPGMDLFHPAARAGDDAGFVEVATSPTSFIARFPRRAAHLTPPDLERVVEDAEQPALSADGRWLAFLRARRGRRGLWLAALDGHGRLAAPPRELVDASYDVLDLGFFPDGRVALSGFRGGRARLFVADPRSGSVAEFATSDRPARYPAVSHQGDRLAYAEEERGSWQLWVADLTSGVRHRVTGGECNVTQPAWFPDHLHIACASDCRRGLGNPALVRIDDDPDSRHMR